jgi:hypothetical protein
MEISFGGACVGCGSEVHTSRWGLASLNEWLGCGSEVHTSRWGLTSLNEWCEDRRLSLGGDWSSSQSAHKWRRPVWDKELVERPHSLAWAIDSPATCFFFRIRSAVEGIAAVYKSSVRIHGDWWWWWGPHVVLGLSRVKFFQFWSNL